MCKMETTKQKPNQIKSCNIIETCAIACELWLRFLSAAAGRAITRCPATWHSLSGDKNVNAALAKPYKLFNELVSEPVQERQSIR